jgi:hypothetical protein
MPQGHGGGAAWVQHFGRYYTEVGSWELQPGTEHT